jgi:uncharacterized protein (DUF2336 family)
LARELYQWVSRSIRQSLAVRFRLDENAFDTAIEASTQEALQGADAQTGTGDPPPDEREAMEQQLIAKLDIAGQLRPGYLLRALRERKLSLFVGGLATLGRFEPAQVRRAVDSDQPELLALACAAVGIDRSVFPTILDLVREQNAGRPGGGQEGARRAGGAFGPFAPDVAGSAFRQALEAG